MSQGEIKYLDSAAYLRDNSGSKATHYKTERIVMQAITGVNEKIRLKMTIAEKGLFCANSVNYIIFNGEINLNYMLALLNSSLLNFIFSKTSTNSNVNGYEIDNLPIIIPDVKRQQSFIPLVEHIFAITTDEDYFQNPTIQAQVKALEQKIDQLVYKLYGLTEDEIRIVEGRNLSR